MLSLLSRVDNMKKRVSTLVHLPANTPAHMFSTRWFHKSTDTESMSGDLSTLNPVVSWLLCSPNPLLLLWTLREK